MVGVGAWRVIIVCWGLDGSPANTWEPGRARSCLCLEVQVGVYTLLHPAPRLCFTLPADTVCGPVGWQPRAQGCWRRWERQAPKAQGMETWAGLLGMEPWSQMNLDWITICALLFPGRPILWTLTYGIAHNSSRAVLFWSQDFWDAIKPPKAKRTLWRWKRQEHGKIAELRPQKLSGYMCLSDLPWPCGLGDRIFQSVGATMESLQSSEGALCKPRWSLKALSGNLMVKVLKEGIPWWEGLSKL